MIAFDTDIVSLILSGADAYVGKLTGIKRDDQYIPIICAEELIRGRLDGVRKLQANKAVTEIVASYQYFILLLNDLRRFQFLPLTIDAETIFRAFRDSKSRVGTQDLRIASICIAHNATLVTRNARDYSQIPGLKLEVWSF